MLRQIKNIKLDDFVRFPLLRRDSQRELPQEFLDTTFDLGVDIALFEKYKREHNFRPTQIPAAAHFLSYLMTVIFENPNSPSLDYSEFMRTLAGRESRVAVLSAHGGNYQGDFVFRSDQNNYLIRDWVSHKTLPSVSTRKYGALILACCNKQGLDPAQAIVPIFYVKGTFGLGFNHTSHLLLPKSS